MKKGDLCTALFPFEVAYIDDDETGTMDMSIGEVFILLEAVEIEELGAIEVQILFENKVMWFNIHANDCNIEYVRRAGSYDIPFMTLQEVEPGSNNSSSLIKTYSPTKIKGYFSHFYSPLGEL